MSKVNGTTPSVIEAFFDDFPKGGKLLIVAHNHPDPDTIASAAALREIAKVLGKAKTTIAYGGMIGRAENANMVKYLKLHLTPIERVDFSKYDRIAMVDTQPMTGNNDLPQKYVPHLVIDHHPKSKEAHKVPYLDIRTEYGATASILTEYMFAYDLPVDKNLATALLYAIKSETQDLGRETFDVDVDCYRQLFPLANKKLLSKIIHARVSRSYFKRLLEGIRNAKLFGNAIVTRLKTIETPDIVPEMADLLLKMEDVAWVLTMGLFEDCLYLSIRTTNTRKDAGKIMKRLVRNKGKGGGHMQIAGGKIPVPNKEPWEVQELKDYLEAKFLKSISKEKEGQQDLVPKEIQ
ncbi:MAG: DHH family phosphoesterase [Bdellovibrionales bacterium]|nr:DHH family phosphoesterase [Bdellovibrionales bacterium]